MSVKSFLVAAGMAMVASNVAAKAVTYTFTVDTTGISGNAILQIGMYAQHVNGGTAFGIWDNIDLGGPTIATSFSDNFDDRDLAQERIGGDWTWYDTNWDNATCAGASSGGFGPYSEGGGGAGNYNALNNNYTRHGDSGGEYFRAGLEPDGDTGKKLNVYHNQYATSACNEIKIFKEINLPAAQLDGEYTFTATVEENQYTAITEGSQVGVFHKILDVDGGYTESAYNKQAEYDNPAPEPEPEPEPTVEPVPALPLVALFALVALVATMGARRRA